MEMTNITIAKEKVRLLDLIKTNDKETKRLIELASCRWQPEDMERILTALGERGVDKQILGALMALEIEAQRRENEYLAANPYVMSDEDYEDFDEMEHVEEKLGLVPIPTASTENGEDIIW
jgi:hypothetical protein